MTTTSDIAPVAPIVILFGYDSSPFTHKVQLALKLRQISYFFVLVPSMMPRPVLVENFNLTYRKIPVLAINKDIYIDTSLIFEIINTHPAFPQSPQHPPLHTSARNQVLTRLLSSHYTDRPLFRLTTGLIPQTVWETNFGLDRASLIGHKLEAKKLGAKVPQNLSALDAYLSILEPLFNATHGWVLGTDSPSGADISFYYQLEWGEKISRGEGINDLTGGGTKDGAGDGMRQIFNQHRYPNLLGWFDRMERYMNGLLSVETRVERSDTERIDALMQKLNSVNVNANETGPLIRTSADNIQSLYAQLGLTIGARVSIAPDDTGKAHPTLGTLIGISTEEIIIQPDQVDGKKPTVEGIRAHFPKVGFVVRPVSQDTKNDQLERPRPRASVRSKL